MLCFNCSSAVHQQCFWVRSGLSTLVANGFLRLE